jgi:hypothetical protein
LQRAEASCVSREEHFLNSCKPIGQHGIACRQYFVYKHSTDIPNRVETVKNAVFWNVTPCGSCKNRRFGATYHLHHKGENNQRTRYNVSSNFVPSSLILFTLMMEAIISSETSVLTLTTRCHIQEDGILHNHLREDFKSCRV